MAKLGRPKGSKNKVVGSIPRAKKAPAKPNGQGALTAEREMPAGDEAAAALVTLAAIQERIKEAEAIELRAKTHWQDAKSEREELDTELKDTLWKLTHKADLPLFDPAQAEADLQQIQEASGAAGSVMEAADEAAHVPSLALPADPVPDDSPF